MKRVLILLFIIVFATMSCKKKKTDNKVNSNNSSELKCNTSSLAKWLFDKALEKESAFSLSKNSFTKFSEDSTLISVIWKYDISNPKLEQDEYVDYCIDLLKEKIEFPKDYNLSFEYILEASCPVLDDMPIDANSEIRKLKVIDKSSKDDYRFSMTKGRLSSGIKYVKDNIGKVTDTIYYNW